MPIYEITDPNTGVTLEVEGASPPTEAELETIFSQAPKPQVPSNPVDRWQYDMADIERRTETGQQSLASGIAQSYGANARFIGGVFGEALSGLVDFIVPNAVQARFNETSKEFFDSPEGQRIANLVAAGGEAYEKFRKENPTLARNAEALLAVGELVPMGKGPTIGIKAAGRQIEISGYKGAKGKRANFIENDLLVPLDTKETRKAQRQNYNRDTGKWEPLQRDLEINDSVFKLTSVSPNKNNLWNLKAIEEGIEREAKRLDEKLSKLDAPMTNEELKNVLFPRLKAAAESEAITGEAKQVLKKHMRKLNQLLAESDKTPLGILNVRRAYDEWVKGSSVSFFDQNTTARQIVARAVRDGLNEAVDLTAQKSGIKVSQSLRNQSNLYRAMDTVETKWLSEYDSFMGNINRWLDKKVGVRLPTSPLALKATGQAAIAGTIGSGISLGTSAAAGLIGTLAYVTARGAISPTTRKYFGQVLRQLPDNLAVERAAIINAMKLPTASEEEEVNGVSLEETEQ